jgi:hypothetical protein
VEAPTPAEIDALKAYLRSPSATSDEIAPVLMSARLLVHRHIEGREVPAEIVAIAVNKVAAELWAARDATGGIVSGFTDDGSGGIRLARDPMVAARPVLAPWVGPVFA